MSIIQSVLDDDLYTFTQQKAVLDHAPGTPVEYGFSNRRPEGKFNKKFFARFEEEIHSLKDVALLNEEAEFLKERVPFLGQGYIEWLKSFRFNPNEIEADLVQTAKGYELEVGVKSPWETGIKWEMPLMATISELFFQECDTNWTWDASDYVQKTRDKAAKLQDCVYAEYGTRRRRSLQVQDIVVQTLKECGGGFVGTSNVHLARKHGVRPIGTMAHQWIMGISALEGLKHANRHALKIWSKVFSGNLGDALTDTFGTDAFLGDFDSYLARLFDGVRHDSGDPYLFGDDIIAHYQKLRINPMHKTIIFSDGLTDAEAVKIAAYFKGRINVRFGIGTFFTNDFGASKALNMVIKLRKCGGVWVVKLSDVKTKQIGDEDALRVANWTFFGTPLDS